MYRVIILNETSGRETVIRRFDDVYDAYDFAADLYETITGKKGFYEVDESFGFEMDDKVMFVRKEFNK